MEFRCQFRQGQIVVVLLGAANHDLPSFRAERWISREDNRHVVFK
jgi:cytochrome P450